LFNSFVFSELDKLADGLGRFIYVLIRFIGALGAYLYISGFRTIHLTYIWEREVALRKTVDQQQLEELIPLKPTLNEMRDEMHRLLLHPRGFDLFKTFLIKEFSVENILFWKDARDFQQSAVEAEQNMAEIKGEGHDPWVAIDDKAKSIFETYCSDNAIMLINLPFGIHNNLKKVFLVDTSAAGPTGLGRQTSVSRLAKGLRSMAKSVTGNAGESVPLQAVDVGGVAPKRRINSTTFADALQEITNLMCSDSFRRFRMQDEYREFVLERFHVEQESNISLRAVVASTSVE